MMTNNPFVLAGHFIKTADDPAITTETRPEYRMRDNILHASLAALGVGAAARGVVGLLGMARKKPKMRYPAALVTDVPYPVQMEPNLVVEFYSR